MGMFDYVKISDAFVEHPKGWQTKSLECSLDLIEIDSSGQLWNNGFYDSEDEEISMHGNKSDFTGAIEVHNTIDKIRWELILLFENGQLLAIAQRKPAKI